MIHESRGQYIGVLTYRGEERREVEVYNGWTAKHYLVWFSGSTFEVRGGLAVTAAAVLVVLPYTPGIRM